MSKKCILVADRTWDELLSLARKAKGAFWPDVAGQLLMVIETQQQELESLRQLDLFKPSPTKTKGPRRE